MLTLLHFEGQKCVQTVVSDTVSSLPEHCAWIDLLDPTKAEEEAIEKLLSLEIPTREEMQEIEVSSRLYVEKNAVVMTLPVLTRSTSQQPESTAVTFILANHILITVRYDDPSPFSTYIHRAAHQPELAASGEIVLLGLLEQIADRLADVLEGATAELEKLSHEIFKINQPDQTKTDFNNILVRIGHSSDLATRAKDSLVCLNRQILFFSSQTSIQTEAPARIETILQDIHSVDEHARFVSEKVGFLLNATLGMLNIEQNNIIKIFSVAAVAFMPPTLIASIYGMNFHHMPELSWPLGYPIALFLMVASGLIPLWHFKRKNWL